MGWESNRDKKVAAKKFLQAVLDDDGLRRQIVKSGDDDRAKARDEFARIGQINVPKETEVICLEPDVPYLDQLVVFKLPKKGRKKARGKNAGTAINPLKHWIAAWVPYRPGKAPSVSGGDGP